MLGNIIASTTRGQFQNNSPFNCDGFSRKRTALIKFSHSSHRFYSHHSLTFWIVPESPHFIIFSFSYKNPTLLQLFDINKCSTYNIGSELSNVALLDFLTSDYLHILILSLYFLSWYEKSIFVLTGVGTSHSRVTLDPEVMLTCIESLISDNPI